MCFLVKSQFATSLASDLEFARLKSVYGYLNNLYVRWHKPEKALEYKKWLNARNEQNKNITHRNA